MKRLLVLSLLFLPACWADCNFSLSSGPSLADKCANFKKTCDDANLLLEESGFPERTSGACTMYRQCMEGK